MEYIEYIQKIIVFKKRVKIKKKQFTLQLSGKGPSKTDTET